MTLVLGIDPGSCVTGFGIVQQIDNQIHYVASGCIRAQNGSFIARLYTIFSELTRVLQQYPVDEAAVEQVFVCRNVQSALKLGQARGAALSAIAAYRHDIKLAEYSPRAIKQAVVGYGGADKKQVQYMVSMLLRLPHTPSVDEADALGVCLCHSFSRRLMKYSV